MIEKYTKVRQISLRVFGEYYLVSSPFYLGIGGREFRVYSPDLESSDDAEIRLGEDSNVSYPHENDPRNPLLYRSDIWTYPVYIRKEKSKKGEGTLLINRIGVGVYFKGDHRDKHFLHFEFISNDMYNTKYFDLEGYIQHIPLQYPRI